MVTDLSRVLGHEFEKTRCSWSEQDVLLYHLGLGAGGGSTTTDLRYVFERDLVVLPTFAVVLGQGGLGGLDAIPGLDYDPRRVLHAEQELLVHRPLPARGVVSSTSSVVELWDKGSAAILVVENTAVDESGDPVFTSRSALYLKGMGGFGGNRGPRRTETVPNRRPDMVLTSPTLVQQALLYRLNGDLNPLHVDPAEAASAGFPRPILHGLCTFGIVCKSVVDAVLGGEPARIREYSVRFAGVLYPGETIVTSLWCDDDVIHLRASTKERGEAVLTHASLRYR